jgi:hypothetical protein
MLTVNQRLALTASNLLSGSVKQVYSPFPPHALMFISVPSEEEIATAVRTASRVWDEVQKQTGTGARS